MNFLNRLFNISGSSKKATSLKLTPEILAVKERIAARKEKEEKAIEAHKRRERLTSSQSIDQNEYKRQSASIKDEIRRLEKRAVRSHNDRLRTDSELMANSKLDLWHNTIAREDPPELIAPDLLLPESEPESSNEEMSA